MKNLGLTIDRIIKIDPSLQEPLLEIKNKWKKSPSKAFLYWKELIDFLNSNTLLNNPKRSEIIAVINPIRRSRKQLYTFEEVSPNERVIGIIPEHIADIIRRYDRKTIRHCKRQVEATMTHDQQLLAKLSRENAIMEINMRRIWLMLKDHFNLWNKGVDFSIKSREGSLVIVALNNNQVPVKIGPLKIGPDILNNLMGMLGIEPPSDDQ